MLAMPSLVVPNGGQLRIGWTINNEPANNVLGLRIATGAVVDQAVANAMATNVTAAIATAALMTVVDSQTSIVQVGIRDLRTANQPEIIGVFASQAGLGAGEQVGHEVAFCVTLRTALAGGKFRGRSYLPLNAAAALDEETATFGAAAASAGVVFLREIRENIAADASLGGNFSLAVISRPDPTEDPPWLGAATPITTEVNRSSIKTTQRRRIPARP